MSTDSITTTKKHTHAHHFRDGFHEFTTSVFGMWLFLATEILMFGGLIVAYILYNGIYPEVFSKGAEALDWRLGAINTIVLLTSSWTMVLGVRSAQVNDNKACFRFCLLTVLGGLIFLGIKYYEYSHKIHLGLLPGQLFSGDLQGFSNLPLYYSFYFCLTGLHGIHVLLGMGLITWVAIRAKRNEFNSEYYTAVENVGLFWHLVDVVWIYLFPMLYLI